nr:hypothetical protein [Seonamhaeicola sp. ML3]
MKYLSIFQYAYLIFAGLFLYNVWETYNKTGAVNYPYLLLAGLAVFMFFFRRRFRQKFQDRNNKS